MGKPTGFIDYHRQDPSHRPIAERVKDFAEIDIPLDEQSLLRQAARCMDCGVPFCHGAGCPLGNRVPEFNDLVYRGRWQEACEVLHSTSNFPEFTGRICPSLCEAACTLNIDSSPVTVRQIELQIVERGWREGWIRPLVPKATSGKKVAIIGSGPSGLAAAQQLARAGHNVTVYEKDSRVGGLLRYGIPDFKLGKHVIDRRLEQLSAEGVAFQTGVEVGQDISAKYLREHYDAVLLAMGAGEPRDLAVPGRELANVHYALDYLRQQNKICAAGGKPAVNGDRIEPGDLISAKGKVVAVIGGGDTGSDCVGTARRQGAREIHQFEILPRPPEAPAADNPWPQWPRILRTSSSHEEGCTRRWSVLTKKLAGTPDGVTELHGIEVQWTPGPKGFTMSEVPGTEFVQKVDLVLLAMGFVHVVHNGLVESLQLKLDARGNVAVDPSGMTSQPGVFAAGDTADGASLVVRAIASGRNAAAAVDAYLRQQH